MYVQSIELVVPTYKDQYLLKCFGFIMLNKQRVLSPLTQFITYFEYLYLVYLIICIFMNRQSVKLYIMFFII